MTKTNYLLGGIAIIAILIALFLGLKVQKLASEKSTNDEQSNSLVQQSQVDVFSMVDESLENGNFEQALKQLNNLPLDHVDDDAVTYRRNIAKRMESMTINHVEPQVVEVLKVDTFEKVVIKEFKERVIALEKALSYSEMNSQVLRAELDKVSVSEYLKFETSKGTQLHYVGETDEGKAKGYGVAILDSGSRYEGEWEDNMRHGEGKFIWADGEIYEGGYKHDLRSGDGTYLWTNKEKYVGEWDDDRRNGQGIFYNKDGKIVARGIWKDDKLEEVDKNGK